MKSISKKGTYPETTISPERPFQSLSLPGVYLVFITLDFIYHYEYTHQLFFATITNILFESVIFTLLLWITTRLDLARVTLCFLAIPYLVFFPGWLNTPSAILLLIIFIYCITRTLHATTSVSNTSITLRDLATFVLILVLVNVSGAGGYGFQWPDYNMHNARLKDLVDYPWPVRYGENKNFVYYFAYFLPSAIVGKLSNVTTALHSMYIWTALGVTLALRWLSVLSRWRFSLVLVLVFALFGPWDIFSLLYFTFKAQSPIYETLASLPGKPESLNFSGGYYFGFFLGNYLPNTFQLYWSPQQVIAGWLGTGLITYLFQQQKTQHVFLIYALLCLWGPLVMIALSPFVLLVAITSLLNNTWRDLISFENTIGAGALVTIFIIFYLGGSAAANPSYWLFETIDWGKQTLDLLLFLLFAWGIYVIALIPFISQASLHDRLWFCCLIVALLLLPMRIFGEWSDLLCRGSAPLMFLLLAFLLKAIHHYWSNKERMAALLLSCVLIPGAGSALLINRISILHYGETQPVNSIIDYNNAYPNLGPDNTLFEKWFRR